MCARPQGLFSEPKIATLGFFVPKIVSFSVFNTEMRLEGPFPADFDSKRLFLFHPLRDEPTRMAARGAQVLYSTVHVLHGEDKETKTGGCK